ncbi:MAG: hypothetical protein SF053_16705 [Bacteroidia bacterium]|nr:hypothetical protein [Bacteroidia bacterium]
MHRASAQALPDEDIVPARTPATRENQEHAKQDSAARPAPIRTAGYPEGLEVGFVKPSEALPPGVMFFNVFKILNNSDSTYAFTPRYQIPEIAGLMVQPQDQQEIILMPGQSRFIPVRLSFPGQTEGGIPFTVAVSLLGADSVALGPPVQASISFQKLTRWRAVSPLTRLYTSYGDRAFVKVPLTVSNAGNVREVLSLVALPGEALEVEGCIGDSMVVPFRVRPGTDTTLEVGLRGRKGFEDAGSSAFTLTLKVRKEGGQEEVIQVVLEAIRAEFVNERKESESPLIVSVRQNVTDPENAATQLNFSGNLLLRQGRDVSYVYEVINPYFTEKAKSAGDAYWRDARIQVSYKTRDQLIRAGDIGGGYGYSVGGRGIAYQKKTDKFTAELIGVRSLNAGTWGYGGAYTRNVSKYFRWKAGYTYQRKPDAQLQVQAASVGTSWELARGHRLTADVTATRLSTYGRGVRPIDERGLGYQAQYGGKLGGWSLVAKNNYASQYFQGTNKGFFYLETEADRRMNNEGGIKLSYTYNRRQIHTRDQEGETLSTGYNQQQRLNLNYQTRIGNMPLAIGTSLQRQYVEQNYTRTGLTDIAGSSQVRAGVSTAFKNKKNSDVVTTPFVQAGVARADLVSFGLPIVNPSQYYLKAGINRQYKYGSVNAEYTYQGAEGLQEHAINPNASYTQLLHLDGSYERELFNERISSSSTATLDYQVQGPVRAEVRQSLRYKTEKGWTFNADMAWKPPFTTGGGTEPSLSVGARKVIEAQQPRMKYYTITIEFFKDENGNRLREETDAGIANVLVTMEQSKDSAYILPEVAGIKFKPDGIMSDQEGVVTFLKVPMGGYEIKLEELFPAMSYSNSQGSAFQLLLRQHTRMLIPYAKSIIVTGKIQITRDKYSRLTGVTPANIRVEVTDANQQTYYALTDDSGNYTLSFPFTETFTVSMKNVLGDKFDLVNAEQPFESKGEQRFEVNFHYKEKGRTINFGGG